MALTALEQQNQNEITNASRAGVGTGAVKQKIAVTDIISEGPIEGLVEGDASVYLNEDRLISDTNNRVYSATIDGVKMSVTNGATSTSLMGVFLSSYENLENATVTRIVTYKNVYSRSDISVGVTGLSDIEEPQVTLTAPSAFFTAIMEKSGNSNVGAARVKTLSGSIVLEGSITTVTNSTTAIFTPSVKDSNYLRYFKAQTEFNTVTLEIDVRARVDFKNADDLNLLNAWAHPTGTYETNLSSPIVQYETGGFNAVQKNNIATTDVEFRPGTLNQAPLSSMFGMHGIAYFPTSFTGRVLEFIDANSKSTGDRQAPQPIRGTASDGFDLSPAQIAEVDVLRLQFNYNSLVSISEKDGKKHDSGASYKISFTPIRNGVDQDEIILAYRTHSGKFETPVAFEEFIYVEPLRPFDDFKVTVDRLTRHDGRRVMTNGEDGNDVDRLQATCSIARISAVMKERLNYPYTALARVSFDSKDYQQVPKRSYHCRGLKVKVPSNYTTREESLRAGSGITVSDLYSGLWDGDFREAKVYTNNPAWILYDILTNNRYGLGRWLEESDIDKYQLYRIGRYCDELVSDGKGGLEPRYVCNAYLTKATDAYKVLKDFATTFLGILYWMDGKVFAVADQATDPVYTFSKANVVNGEFTYQGTSAKVRPNQLTVMWNNPLANYELEPLLVEDKENIAKTGKIIRQEAVAFGCTSEAQAYRYGKWKLWTGVNQREIITFKTSINATFLAPGDVIKVQDADQYDISYSGRVSGTPSTTLIPIDREITINAGSTYELSCIFEDTSTEDGSTNTPKNTKVETRTLTSSITGPVSSLQVDIPFSSAPTKSSVWVLREESSLGVSDASEKEYKIVSVSEDSKDTYSISALEYFDSKYESIEGDFTLAVEERVSPELTAEEVSFAPKNVFLYPTQDPSKAGNEVTLRWDFPLDSTNTLSANVKGFEIVHSIPSQESPIFVKADTTEYLFTNLPDGIFAVGIRTVDSIGKRSPQVEAQIDVQDVFKLKIPRQAEGLPVGGVGSAAIELNTNYEVNFSVSTPSFSPPGDPTNIKTAAITSLDTLDTDFTVGKKYFVLYDSSAEALKGVEYKTDTTYGINHWSTPTSNDFSVSSGTVTIEANSNKVIGTSTSFLTEFAQGSIIYFSSTKAAKVTNIVNNTFLLIDRVFDTTTSGPASYNTLSLDFELDSLIGEFVRTSTTTSTFKSYCSVDTDIAPQSQKTIAIYRKNSSDIDASGGTFADPLAGNPSWSQSVPGLTANGDVVYVSTRTFTSDGLTPQEASWQSPVVYASRIDGTDGTDADPLTVSSSYDPETGVTTITFSDGSPSITINDGSDGTDGTDGTSQGVIVLYSNTANPADNSAISLSQGSNAYVHYYEWLNSYTDADSDGIPDDAHEKTFVKFIGEDGATGRVTPIYSTVADPTDNTGLSLSPGTRAFVSFYEYTGDKITQDSEIPTNAHEFTYVRFQGETGPQGNTGFLFYSSGDATLDAAHITLSNPSIGQVAIVENTSGDQKGYIYTETAPSTFEWVESQIVNRGIIFADAIGAGQLEISANADSTANSIFFDGENNSIKIYSDNGSGGSVLRVRLGNLTDTP